MKFTKTIALTLALAAGMATVQPAPSYAKPKANIAETAMSAPQFSTLVAAVKAAGLVDAFTGKDKLTVFAPTNDAFAKLPAGTVESLLKPENKETLVSILKYHVVAGEVPAKAALKLPSGTHVPSLNGEDLVIHTKHGVQVSPGTGARSTVILPDVHASNGVIHGIDSVLLPLTVQAAMAGK